MLYFQASRSFLRPTVLPTGSCTLVTAYFIRPQSLTFTPNEQGRSATAVRPRERNFLLAGRVAAGAIFPRETDACGLSYSRKDFYFAESLAFHLADCGIESWLDANHLAPGGDWGQEIGRALDEAHTFILVATPASMRSPYVEREWKRALAQGDRLFVALFRSCKLPPELQQARAIDFCGAFRPALRRLTGLLEQNRRLHP